MHPIVGLLFMISDGQNRQDIYGQKMTPVSLEGPARYPHANNCVDKSYTPSLGHKNPDTPAHN